jgi:hypothetical protein
METPEREFSCYSRYYGMTTNRRNTQMAPCCNNYQDSRSAPLTNKRDHLAAAASWFLALGADGSAATDLAVTSNFEDTMETFFKDTTICPCTSLSYNINHIGMFTIFSASAHPNCGPTCIITSLSVPTEGRQPSVDP